VVELAYDELLWSAEFTFLLILCAILHGLVLAEAAARYRARGARRRIEAEQRASALLKEWLSPAQRAQYESNGHFDVTGCHNRKRYRIRSGRQMNIDEFDEHGKLVAVWCFVPERYVPAGDVMLAQKIALENDERAVLAVANRNQ
jgi:hypothetical protein